MGSSADTQTATATHAIKAAGLQFVSINVRSTPADVNVKRGKVRPHIYQ